MSGKKINTKGFPKDVSGRDATTLDPSFKGDPLRESWIATVTLANAGEQNYDTQKRLDILSRIILDLRGRMPDASDGLVILPGGWIDTGEKKPEAVYETVGRVVAHQLNGTQITVCLGIDGGMDMDGFAVDQIGMAISCDGVQAVGRKFRASPQERGHVDLCNNYTAGESGYPRTFYFNGKTCFIAVCYDAYGIRQKNLANPGVDCVTNLVHCFYPLGQGPSGHSYFAWHGFAGTSKQWGCPVFGTAIFYHREIPPRWPTGVMWTSGEKSTARWRYEENGIQWTNQYALDTDEGKAIIRVYDGNLLG